ncbi:MAG: Lrp/AsnC family transcriptional regulator [Roseiflexaceae bacterium]|nr:Lrp/AsnC family transcriptional regulator [Roseiflexaceae bacterium]
MRLDEIDLKLLELLQQNGRTPHTALGKAVGLSSASVYARVQQLEQAGVIKGYTALLDAEKLGGQIVAFIHVTTRPNAEEYTLFERFVVDEPSIIECHDVTGDDNYILKAHMASLDELRDLLARIRTLPPVTQTRTAISLAQVKDQGLVRFHTPAQGEDT